MTKDRGNLKKPSATARGVLKSARNGTIVMALPGTDYELHLVSGAPESTAAMAPGRRLEGTIEARALRMHAARGGGRFIEPVQGAPRIVAGAVRAVDEAAGRVLVEAAVPMWVAWPAGQDTSILKVGQLVNFHVQSGTRFVPATRPAGA